MIDCRFAAIWVALVIILLPNYSYALAPSKILGATVVKYASDGTPVISNAPLWAEVASVNPFINVGMVAGYLLVEALFEDKTDSIRVPLGPNAWNQPPEPEVDQSQHPATVPATPVVYDGWALTGFPCAGSPEAACAADGGDYWPQKDTCTYSNDPWKCYPNGCSIGRCQMNSVGPCPPGYKQVGVSCMIDNSRELEDDHTCDILFRNGAFGHAADMNCLEVTEGRLTPLIRDGNIYAYGVNSKGEPLMWSVTPGVQGATVESYWYVRQYEQVQTDVGTQVKKTEIAIDSATSTVTSVSTSTSPGAISVPSGATTGGAIPAVTDPVTQPTTQVNTPTVKTTDALSIVFPTDYARIHEAGNAADKIIQNTKDQFDRLLDHDNPPEKEPDCVNNPDGEGCDSGGDGKLEFFGDTFDSLLGWSLPNHNAVCPTAEFDLRDWIPGLRLVMDAHCPILEDNRSVLSGVMIAAWLCLALFIVLRA